MTGIGSHRYHVDLTGTDLTTAVALVGLLSDQFDVVHQEGDQILSIEVDEASVDVLEARGAKATSLDDMRRQAPPIA
jgi:archaellum component FlaC